MLQEKERGIGPIPNPIVIFVLVVAVSLGSIYVYSEISGNKSGKGTPESKGDYKTFISENYRFSFTYPPDWAVENMKNPYTGVLIVIARENVTENTSQVKAGVQIYAGNLRVGPLENARNNMLTQAENNENLSIIKGPNNVTKGGLNGLDVILKVKSNRREFESRALVLKGENIEYWITSSFQENLYENFGHEVENIVESFTILRQ